MRTKWVWNPKVRNLGSVRRWNSYMAETGCWCGQFYNESGGCSGRSEQLTAVRACPLRLWNGELWYVLRIRAEFPTLTNYPPECKRGNSLWTQTGHTRLLPNINALTHSPIHSCCHSFTLTKSLNHSFIQPFIPSHSLIHSPVHSLTLSLILSLTHSISLIHSFARSLTHSLHSHIHSHSLIHSLTPSFTQSVSLTKSLINSIIQTFTHSLIHSL
jgi:hypothetical protein